MTEIVIVNEEEDYLLGLVHEIGMRAHNIAVGSSIRCIRCSIFSSEDALLEKHWNIQNVLHNMDLCRRKLETNGESTHYLRQIDFTNMDNADQDTNDYVREEIAEEEWKEF